MAETQRSDRQRVDGESAETVLSTARNESLCIETTSSLGVTTTFVFVALETIDDGVWVMQIETAEHGGIVEPPTVMNQIRLCDPDVWLVPEEQTVFGERE